MDVKQFSDLEKELWLTDYITGKEISNGAEKLLRFVLNFPLQRPVKISELAKELKMSRSTIYRHYEELEKKGVLKGNGKQKTPPTKK